MNDLQEKINKAIDEALPAELGNALRKRLLMLDAAVEENITLKGKIDNFSGETKRLLERVTSLDQSLAQHGLLKVREDAVKAREEKAAVTELEIRLKAEEKISASLGSALSGLVRNVEYRNQVFTNEPIAVPYVGGGASVAQHQGSKTETKEAK